MKKFSDSEILRILSEAEDGSDDEVVERHAISATQLLIWRGKFKVQPRTVDASGKRTYKEVRSFHVVNVLSTEEQQRLCPTVESVQVKKEDGSVLIITKAPNGSSRGGTS